MVQSQIEVELVVHHQIEVELVVHRVRWRWNWWYRVR